MNFFEDLFQKAYMRFEQYLTNYDVTDPKIHLKIVHTYGVVDASTYMANALHLNEEDTFLAKIIALLHDIGRFEQLKKFNSFDDSIMPHAQCSVDVLFQEGLIAEFVPIRQWDEIIKTAIQYHGVYKMPTNLIGKALLHTQLIRDEDKIDNFRVKAFDSVVAMVDVTAEELGSELITEKIFNDFMNEKPILNADRKTHMDMWVSYIAYLFDFNFPEAIAYLTEKDYICQIIDRIPYSNNDTMNKMNIMKEKALNFAKTRMEFISDYEIINLQLQGLLEGETDEIVAMANASAHLYDCLSGLNWLGFYRLIDGLLVLGPFQGKVACTRIPLTKGVCGACVTRGETIVVPNVHEFPGHIACDSASNSEIVIPIRDNNGQIRCILDIDSPHFDRFSEVDQKGLEKAMEIIEKIYN